MNPSKDIIEEAAADAAEILPDLQIEAAKALAKRVTGQGWARTAPVAIVLGRFDVPFGDGEGSDYPTIGVMLIRPAGKRAAAAVLVLLYWHPVNQAWAGQDVLGPQAGPNAGRAPKIPWEAYRGNWMGEPSSVNGDFTWKGPRPKGAPPQETTAAPGEESIPGAEVRSWRLRLGGVLRRWGDRLTSQA